MKVDTRDFEKALKNVLAHTSRDFPKVINGACIEIITTAAKLTKKADKEAIDKKLTTGTVTISSKSIAGSILSATKALKKPKTFAKPAPMVYKIINARLSAKGKPGLNNADMSKAAQSLIRRRKAAVGFVAFAGWQKALLAFGGRGFGSKGQQAGFDKSTASRGYGIKAREGARMVAKFVNTAAACERYGAGPLQQAVNSKTRAFIERLEQKLSERCREASRR